jgi:hypothetical protein
MLLPLSCNSWELVPSWSTPYQSLPQKVVIVQRCSCSMHQATVGTIRYNMAIVTKRSSYSGSCLTRAYNPLEGHWNTTRTHYILCQINHLGRYTWKMLKLIFLGSTEPSLAALAPLAVHFVESQTCSFMVHPESLTGFISMKQRRFLDNYSCHVLLVESRNIITVRLYTKSK